MKGPGPVLCYLDETGAQRGKACVLDYPAELYLESGSPASYALFTQSLPPVPDHNFDVGICLLEVNLRSWFRERRGHWLSHCPVRPVGPREDSAGPDGKADENRCLGKAIGRDGDYGGLGSAFSLQNCSTKLTVKTFCSLSSFFFFFPEKKCREDKPETTVGWWAWSME